MGDLVESEKEKKKVNRHGLAVAPGAAQSSRQAPRSTYAITIGRLATTSAVVRRQIPGRQEVVLYLLLDCLGVCILSGIEHNKAGI